MLYCCFAPILIRTICSDLSARPKFKTQNILEDKLKISRMFSELMLAFALIYVFNSIFAVYSSTPVTKGTVTSEVFKFPRQLRPSKTEIDHQNKPSGIDPDTALQMIFKRFCLR